MYARIPALPRPASRSVDRMMALCPLLMCASGLLYARTWLQYGPSAYRTAESIRLSNSSASLSLAVMLGGVIMFLFRLRSVRSLGARKLVLGSVPMRGVHLLAVSIWGISLSSLLLRHPGSFADLVGFFPPGLWIFMVSLPALLFLPAIHEAGICDPTWTGNWRIPWTSIRKALVADESNSLILMLKDGSMREIEISRTTPDEVRRILAARMPREGFVGGGTAGEGIDSESTDRSDPKGGLPT